MIKRSGPVVLLLLGWLILFAQMGATLHELGHAFEDIRYSQHPHPPGGHHDFCDQCAAYAPGCAAIPPSPVSPLAEAGPFVLDLPSQSADLPLRTVAPYRSRAPPPRLAT